MTKLSKLDLVKVVKALLYSNRYSKLRLLLQELANKTEIEQYRIGDKLNWSYRSSLRLLHLLNDLGFAEIIRTEPSIKKGKDRNFWRITSKGMEFWRLIEK